MNRFLWSWHRLRAMSAAEMVLHARKKFRQSVDGIAERDWAGIKLEAKGAYPKLPPPGAAPAALREALKHDVEEICSGRWRAFGHLPLLVDDPPRWHKDYLANADVETRTSAFKLNHRHLPNGADVKLIWELSRWYQLVRLGMAAYVLDDKRAAEKCVMWLADWVKHNPPFQGWNWTSALETGLRLIQFTWIDGFLCAKAEQWGFESELDTLRYEILPPHAFFTSRYKSFGSSANNHLIGELAGLIIAMVRWPALLEWASTLDELQKMWEREMLAQFAEDGGNREQALNYHLFSFELCLHTRNALMAAGRKISPEINQRFDAATRFFWDVQSDREQWDYGDSDNAYVLPVFTSDKSFVREWRNWMGKANSPVLDCWLDAPPTEGRAVNSGPPVRANAIADWWWYKESGIAVCECGFWWLRWDVSPLGYLATAAHGHLDALHLSVWFKGVPFVVDPGTGAYYADERLRNWMTSRAAHNAPCAPGPEWPQRRGPFLWEQHHDAPAIAAKKQEVDATLALNNGGVRRRVALAAGGLNFDVEDEFTINGSSAAPFSVRWQFAPGTSVKRVNERVFTLTRKDVSITIEVNEGWNDVHLIEEKSQNGMVPDATDVEREFAGTVSPGFRKTEWAPYLKLIARPTPGQSCVFRTTFIASSAP